MLFLRYVVQYAILCYSCVDRFARTSPLSSLAVLAATAWLANSNGCEVSNRRRFRSLAGSNVGRTAAEEVRLASSRARTGGAIVAGASDLRGGPVMPSPSVGRARASEAVLLSAITAEGAARGCSCNCTGCAGTAPAAEVSDAVDRRRAGSGTGGAFSEAARRFTFAESLGAVGTLCGGRRSDSICLWVA
jgi:hypothetical protein